MGHNPTSNRKSAKATIKISVDPSKSLDAAPRLGSRVLNVQPDATDLRDRIYEPSLLDLKLKLHPPESEMSPVRDQGQEGACTGFALSSAITLMNRHRHKRVNPTVTVPMASPRMLYEMAKVNDEWPGEDYEGSSIRGALKGFYHNGSCSDDIAPYSDGDQNWHLSVQHAKDARGLGLGAYFRLKPEIIDYHAALNEVGVIYVSATIHRGWQKPTKGDIEQSHLTEGGHAFIIVGYDETGFLIQNLGAKAGVDLKADPVSLAGATRIGRPQLWTLGCLGCLFQLPTHSILRSHILRRSQETSLGSKVLGPLGMKISSAT